MTPDYLTIILALAATMAAWYALRRLVGAAVGIAAGVLTLSYLSDPSHPFALALQVWGSVQQPALQILAVLWALTQRAISALSGRL